MDTSSVTEGHFQKPNKLTIGKDNVPSRARRKVKKNDIVYSTVRPIQRHYGFIRESEEHLIVSTGFAVLTPDETVVDPYYLYCFLTLNPNIELLQAIAENSTSAYPSIKPRDISELEIELPNLDTQKSISIFLRSINEKIDLNNQITSNLEELSKNLFKNWFIDFEFPNEGGEPYRSSGGKMVESELGWIPAGWEVSKVKDVAQNVGKNVKISEIDNETPYIGLEHMPRASVALSSWETSEKVNSNKKSYKKKDILFGKLRPYFKKVGIAPTNGICSTDILVINSIKAEHFSFLVCLLTQDKFIEYCNQTSTGTRMPRAGWQAMGDYKLALPPIELASKFEDLLNPFFDQILSLIYQNKKLEGIRKSLIPRLLSGEIVINEESEEVENVLV